MAKLTLTNTTSGYSAATVMNANNDLIEAALENTLSRDGTSPNTMSADLDMNSNKVTNLTDGVNPQDAATVSQLVGTTAVTGQTLITKTTDESKSTDTTLADDTELAGFSLDPDSIYLIEGCIHYFQDVGDIKFRIQRDNAQQSGRVLTQGGDSDNAAFVDIGISLNSTIAVTTMGDSNNASFSMTGHIETHATLQTLLSFQWAQNTSSANDTIVYAGSWIRVTKVS